MHDTDGIRCNQLSKQYHGTSVLALDHLTLRVNRGEVYGFLGANGAGKTTTIRLLMNFLQPSSGDAVILGMDTVDDSVEIKKHVGYLSGDISLYPKATGKQLLDYLGKLQGMESTNYRTTLEQRFQAELDKPIASLSKGNKQKLGILQALMHEPDVLILDEPTSGLDPLMQEAFYDSLREAKERGAAVFMSSHNLTEAQRVCDRVGIIKNGKLLREQTITSESSLDNPIFRVRFASEAAAEKMKKSPDMNFLAQEDDRTIVVRPTGTISRGLKVLAQQDIVEFSSQALDLESEFIEYYGDEHAADN
ncbi:MAG TPA: ABC transporter ATP-binding protein [Candidatus Saccharimonadales bacterium]|nr:ABC transporter ATP-binding protein [Candidatus Saccharimonadales bacterium]